MISLERLIDISAVDFNYTLVPEGIKYSGICLVFQNGHR